MLSQRRPSWNYIGECEAAIRRNCSDAAVMLAGLRDVLNGHLPSFVATYACPFNGLHHWFQVLISAFDFGGKRQAVLMHVDVSALQVDPLTGLPNRAMFDAQLDLAISLTRDLGRRTGVMIVDMNKLKLINDVHGHRIGDEALRALAAKLKQMAGPDCVASRIGGDEFGVVLPSGLRCSVCDANMLPFRSGHRLLDRVRTWSHNRLRERRNGTLSRRRCDRRRAARLRPTSPCMPASLAHRWPKTSPLCVASQRCYEPYIGLRVRPRSNRTTYFLTAISFAASNHLHCWLAATGIQKTTPDSMT